jgi:hypothetical protein
LYSRRYKTPPIFQLRKALLRSNPKTPASTFSGYTTATPSKLSEPTNQQFVMSLNKQETSIRKMKEEVCCDKHQTSATFYNATIPHRTAGQGSKA